MAMWKYFINPYSVAYKSRGRILYHSLQLENSINQYIDAIQAIEKDIDPNYIDDQIEIAYQLKELSENIESVLAKIKEHPIVKELKTNTEN